MNESTKNFLEAWHEIMSAPSPELQYRLYYDAHGEPVEYTTDDRPGDYIVIDQETYSLRSHRVRIIDGKVVRLRDADRMLLRPDSQGQACHPSDVSIVISEHQDNIKWRFS